ncbi:Glycogen biosynthesis protein GlgD [bioreactor metagenome]|uniref:Glycogen biosynthesis protein GlgD n=1 Tax=bioreactor metagenome TaxID=1076179 RepID=A0A645G8C2_9ZZZZ
MLEEHIKSGADITAVCTRQPQAVPRTGTYFTLSAEGFLADAWVGESVRGCLSLEVYVLSARLLLSLIEHCASHGIWSFSGGVLGAMTTSLKIAPWFFSGYAARFQAVEDYYARSMDLLDPAVRQDLFAPGREVRTKDRSDPSTYYGPESACANSLVADGCVIEGQVRDSILFRGVRVEAGAQVSGCILMQGVTISREACLNFAVADKNALIHPGRMLMGHQSYPLVIAKNAVI